jgi:hypothetical protein
MLQLLILPIHLLIPVNAVNILEPLLFVLQVINQLLQLGIYLIDCTVGPALLEFFFLVVDSNLSVVADSLVVGLGPSLLSFGCISGSASFLMSL